MKYGLVLVPVMALLAIALGASGAETSPSAAFIKEAMEGNMWEVQVGQLANRKGSDEGVRKFGTTLNSDHGKAEQKAIKVGQSLGLSAPTKLNAKHQAKYDALSKLSGTSFDQKFIKEMVEDHEQDIAKYEKQAESSDDDASTYAKETLPVLRHHLEIAQGLQSKA